MRADDAADAAAATPDSPAPGAADTSNATDTSDAAAAPDTSDDGPALASGTDPDALPPRRGLLRRRKPAKPKRKAPWWELPALVVVAILIAIGVKSFVIQPFYIPSGSMEHTLHGCPGCEGDRILVNKTIYYFRDPEPGDIVVFNLPKDWTSTEPTSTPPSNPILRAIRGFGQLIGFVPPDGEVLVKRVIAVGGQTVKGDAQGRVWVKNAGSSHYRLLHEPYVYIDKSEGGLFAFGPVTIPKGRLWVMGDHRSNSADSRFHCNLNGSTDAEDEGQYDAQTKTGCSPVISTVPDGDVIGKAIVIAWPPSRWRTLGTPSTFESAGETVVQGGLPGLAVVPLFLLRRRRRGRR